VIPPDHSASGAVAPAFTPCTVLTPLANALTTFNIPGDELLRGWIYTISPN
jgi:hypothetical protein